MEWIDIADRLLDWAIPFVCATAVGWAVAQVKAERKKRSAESADDSALRDGVQALLRNELIGEYNHRMKDGEFPIYARENVTAMYNAYHALGGNGTITQLYEELQHLPMHKDPPHEVSDDTAV